MKRFIMVLTSILLVGLLLWGTFCFAPIPFIQKWRNIWIETAMSTTSFQWLADKLMPPVVVDAVMEERVESEVIVQDIEVVEDDIAMALKTFLIEGYSKYGLFPSSEDMSDFAGGERPMPQTKRKAVLFGCPPVPSPRHRRQTPLGYGG